MGRPNTLRPPDPLVHNWNPPPFYLQDAPGSLGAFLWDLGPIGTAQVRGQSSGQDLVTIFFQKGS